MTTTARFALGLSMFLAVATFGGAATAKGGTTATAAAAAVSPGDASSTAEENERANRWFTSMFARCQNGAPTESTHNHCLAATNLATKVLQDARRAEDVYRVRCAKFGASDVGNPACPSVLDRASVEAHAAR